MNAKSLNHLSIEDYINIEASSDIKYEYHDGYIVALAGGTINHSRICVNIYAAFRAELNKAGKKCEVFNSDLKVSLSKDRSYVYPDASIVCGDLEMDTELSDAIKNPILIVEVLSDSTASYDRGKKFRKYRKLPSLKYYVLIEQDVPVVDIYERNNDIWAHTIIEGIDQEVSFPSLNVTIPLAEIYENVKFPPEEEEELA